MRVELLLLCYGASDCVDFPARCHRLDQITPLGKEPFQNVNWASPETALSFSLRQIVLTIESLFMLLTLMSSGSSRSQKVAAAAGTEAGATGLRARHSLVVEMSLSLKGRPPEASPPPANMEW